MHLAALVIASGCILLGIFLLTNRQEQQTEETSNESWKTVSSDREESTTPEHTTTPQIKTNDISYKNENYGFTFEHPKSVAISEIAEDTGTIIFAQGTSEETSFQIFITPWDETLTVMTAERIHHDLPKATIENPQEIVIDSGTHALMFEGQAEGVGQTREVWVIHSGSLYQITTPLVFDNELGKIMHTWRFE